MKKVVCGFVLVLILFSCKKELTEEQKVFLDFARLEDSYSGGGGFYNLDVYSSYASEPVYYDSIFNFEKLKAELQGSTKIVKDDDGYIRIDYSQTSRIQYPFKLVLTKNKSNSYNAKMLIFIPDGYERFSIDKSAVGEKISKEGVNITVLDFRNDAVTLAIENTSKKQNYSYTYGERNENEDSSDKSAVGYFGYLFKGESIERPNSSRESRNEKNKDIQVDFDRLNISLVDDDGKTIESEGRITDFRHYLWYRNNDMPYPEMQSSYLDIKNRYKEEDTNPNHLYNGIDIVNIRGLGKIKKLNFFLRSNKGQVKTIDLGAIPVLEKKEEEDKDNEYAGYSKYESYANINDSIVRKDLKINISTLDKESSYMIYASLPPKYSENLGFSFSDMSLKASKKDSIRISDYKDAMSRINTLGYYTSNIDAIEIVNENNGYDNGYDNVVGEIEIDKPIYEEKIYEIKNLPKGYMYDIKNKSLEIKFEDGYYSDYTIYGVANSKSKEAIPNVVRIIESDQIQCKFKNTPSHIIIRHRKEVVNISVPFNLKMLKKTEESKI
jgi:hypothetical protein